MTFPADPLLQYALAHSSKESPLCKELREHTLASFEKAQMMIDPLVAALLKLLVQLRGASRVLELGCFTGYSALSMAEEMPENSSLITLDLDPVATAVARKYWRRSPHGEKIELLLGDALASLQNLEGDFDLIFIDADKTRYPEYLQWSFDHVSQGSLIVLDNVFKGGRVLDSQSTGAGLEAVRRANQMAQSHSGFHKVLLPIRDGLFILRKRS